MRKRIISRGSPESLKPEPDWLDLERLAQVEVTSEDAAHPIEAALVPGAGSGWRAAEAGEQTIRLLFDEPQRIRRIRLRFREESGRARTQEFVLRWSAGGGQPYREILRQQYNFSPPAVTSEVEDYGVNLDGVAGLEMAVIPDISGGDAPASLEQMRLA
ncbi:MAG TPA: hypothetical protein VFD58_15840 [Blastocatellia bacterium]|nr:hypothetical protein [Blastocatellia bacterium]